MADEISTQHMDTEAIAKDLLGDWSRGHDVARAFSDELEEIYKGSKKEDTAEKMKEFVQVARDWAAKGERAFTVHLKSRKKRDSFCRKLESVFGKRKVRRITNDDDNEWAFVFKIVSEDSE